MTRLIFIALLELGAIGVLRAELSKEEPRAVEVENAVSWSTPLGPEVHVLLRNRSSQAIPFSIAFWGFGKRSVDTCRTAPNASRQVALFGESYSAWSRGVIPGGGWAHRSIALGGDVDAPCAVPFRLEFEGGEATIDGKIQIPDERPAAPDIWSPRAVRLAVSSMVETVVRAPELRILRVLVENRSQETADVSVVDRAIVCRNGSHLSWALHGIPPREGSVGPVRVKSSSWGVLEMALRVINGTDRDCNVQLVIGAADPGGGEAERMERYEFSMNPSGSFEPLAL